MDSFTIELVSNASLIIIRIVVLILFTIFLPEQMHLKEECGVATSEISYLSLYQNVTEGKFTLIDGRESPVKKRKILVAY